MHKKNLQEPLSVKKQLGTTTHWTLSSLKITKVFEQLHQLLSMRPWKLKLDEEKWKHADLGQHFAQFAKAGVRDSRANTHQRWV
jgi:hypothetical protein